MAIKGEEVGIVIAMREYIASLKNMPIRDDKALIIAVLESMIDFVEELQRQQWRNNELSTGAKMRAYSPNTIRRYKKKQTLMNLHETGELYNSVKAEVDSTLTNMFNITIDSPRYDTNYYLLGMNNKIGYKEDGEPVFLGLSPANEAIVQAEYQRRFQQARSSQ
jgi:hypothetical protein